MIALIKDPINREALVRQLRKDYDGAVITFDGVVRNNAMGKTVRYLEYEAYEPMALRQMEDIRRTAKERWPISEMAIVHRLGRMEIGESSVLIVVTSPHRRAAFEACRFGIDTLKQSVPIWKKEFYTDGEAWIEGQK